MPSILDILRKAHPATSILFKPPPIQEEIFATEEFEQGKPRQLQYKISCPNLMGTASRCLQTVKEEIKENVEQNEMIKWNGTDSYSSPDSLPSLLSSCTTSSSTTTVYTIDEIPRPMANKSPKKMRSFLLADIIETVEGALTHEETRSSGWLYPNSTAKIVCLDQTRYFSSSLPIESLTSDVIMSNVTRSDCKRYCKTEASDSAGQPFGISDVLSAQTEALRNCNVPPQPHGLLQSLSAKDQAVCAIHQSPCGNSRTLSPFLKSKRRPRLLSKRSNITLGLTQEQQMITTPVVYLEKRSPSPSKKRLDAIDIRNITFFDHLMPEVAVDMEYSEDVDVAELISKPPRGRTTNAKGEDQKTILRKRLRAILGRK